MVTSLSTKFDRQSDTVRHITFVVGYGNLILLPSALVNSGHIHDAVGINIKGHLDLRDSSRGRGDSNKLKFPQQVVVFGHGSFTLKHLHM